MSAPEHSPAPAPNWLRRAHLVSGLMALPFLLISIVIGLLLTHTNALTRLSQAVYSSLPIPQVALNEPVRPGSWDQALALVAKTGAEPYYVGERDNGQIEVVGLTGKPAADGRSSHVQRFYAIDPATMHIVRAEDESNSLFRQAHNVHGWRAFKIGWLSVALITSVALLVQVATGCLMAWRRRQQQPAAPKRSALLRGHGWVGVGVSALTLIIVFTTLVMEFMFVDRDATVSHPIPAVSLAEPLRPNSIDQARSVAAQVMGVVPRSAFVYSDEHRAKFSEAGDGIGGKSVWINTDTMHITRITDWRNDPITLNFIIHDGRWLGGMNALNINDMAALGLLFLVLSGTVLAWRRWHVSNKESMV